MIYHKTTLPSGLRVITIPMPSSESVTVTVWVHVGSRFENDKIAGLSHFIEHISFKGSEKYPSAHAISSIVDSIGAEFNAGTSKEWTNFYIQSAKTHLEKAFDVLSDMILNPLILEEEVEREKGVILEEMAMYEDTPIRNIGDVFEEKIFDGSTLGRDTIGFTESLKAMKRNDFIKFRNIFYYPKNMLITVAGGTTEKEVNALSKKYFGKLPANKISPKAKAFKSKQTKPQIKLKYKKIEQAHLIVGFKSSKYGAKERFAESILATILGAGMSSRLFIEVRERRGLAYSVRTSPERYTDTGYIATYAGVDPKKAEEALKVILDEHFALRDGLKKVTDEELKKAKEFTKGHLALSLEDTAVVDQLFGEQELLKGKIDTPEDIFARIDEVTINDVLKTAKKLFTKDNLTLAIIGPYNNEDKFKKLLV